MERRIRMILRVIPAAFLALMLYVILHEGGHTVVALLAGSRITEFNIFLNNAHMSFDGGNYSPFMTMWLHANGALLPLVVSFVYALIFRKEIRNSFYRIFSFLFCMVSSISLIVWVVIPVLYLNGVRDMGEDGFKFVDEFSRYFSPLIVSVVALLLMSIGIFLIVWKGLLKSYISEIKAMRHMSSGKLS